MTNYEKIKEACQKANPKLMELSFGCKFKIIGNIGINHLGTGVVISDDIALFDCKNHSFSGYGHREMKTDMLVFEKSKFEILGQEPTLADVLCSVGQDVAVVGAKDGKACFLRWGQPPVGVEGTRGYWNYKSITWDLTKSLKDQSEECLNFLADLL